MEDKQDNQEIQWFYGGDGAPAPANESGKKLPYVSTWGNFNKLPDDEKAKTFNAMRGALIAYGLMENGK